MRRNWFIAAIVVGVLAIAVAALAMRLGDDRDGAPESTAAWAESVCASLSGWKASIESLADVGGEALTPDLLRQRLDDAESVTADLVSELRALGAPELEAGAELEQELDASIGQLESSFDDLKEAADDAAGASGGDFLQALAGLASQFSAFLTAIQSTVDRLRDSDVAGESRAELEQAFADAASCQSLRTDS